MDCLSPIKIVNQSKVVSLDHRERVVLFVRCNKCAACQQYNRNIWYFRAFYEWKSCIENNGYVYFDCLTYSPKHVPKISHYFDVPKSQDCYCFDYEQLRLFFVRLRRRLRKYDIENNLRYFAATEYGTKLNGTHRPHIHLLFYVTSSDLDSLTLSKAVSSCWPFGRTDGIPYKSRKYVQSNTIGNNLQSSLRVCQYISKYVMKDSSFQKRIDERMQSLLFSFYKRALSGGLTHTSFEDWQNLPDGKLWKRRINSRIGQFHRQSLHFGESALRDMDINDIMNTNLLTIPDLNNIVMRVGLPLYYKRKLFYELVKFDSGYKTWQPTELGKQYLRKRENDIKDRLYNTYMVANNHGIVFDIDDMVDYVMNLRGRIKAEQMPLMSFEEKLELQNVVFMYISICDKQHFNKSIVSFNYCGFKDNYVANPFVSLSIDEFISKYVYFDADKEHILSLIERERTKFDELKQRSFDNLTLLRQKYKDLQLL